MSSGEVAWELGEGKQLLEVLSEGGLALYVGSDDVLSDGATQVHLCTVHTGVVRTVGLIHISSIKQSSRKVYARRTVIGEDNLYLPIYYRLEVALACFA